MTHDETVSAANVARNNAFNAVIEIEGRIAERVREASAAIRAEFRAELEEARGVLYRAQEAVRVAMADTPDHPWTGKRVRRTTHKLDSWRRARGETVQTGVVEMRRLDTTFAANASSHMLPRIGAEFVRAIRKDGSVGMTVLDRAPLTGWVLEEGEGK
jgi:hypothetical protein